MKQIETVNLTTADTERQRARLALGLICSLSIAFHLLWLSLDRSLPTWDEAAHLTNALNFQRVVNDARLFSPDWWHELWAQAPGYRAPFVYILTVPFFNLFAKSFNAGVLVNLLFIPPLAYATYYLGKTTFDRRVGVWAAGLCLMFPSLLGFQLNYLLDYGIVALTLLNFLVMTLWKDAATKIASWRWSLVFGILFGCLLLTKPTGFLFLLFPGIFLLAKFVKQRNWLGWVQAGVVLAIAWAICGSWYRQNWLTIITSAISANAMGTGEGDPSGTTLAGWLYYLKLLPELISTPLLIIAIGSSLLWLIIRAPRYPQLRWRKIIWLLGYAIGAYSFCSLATNKDGRFISPLLPVISIFLAANFNLFQTTWLRRLRWFAVVVNGLLLVIQMFPIPATDGLRSMTQVGYSYPHKLQPQPDLSSRQLIRSIIDDQPYLRSTIGSMVSSPEINFENLDFYGQANDFQVYAREFNNTGDRQKQIRQLIDRDLKAYNWYALKTGEIGKIDRELLPIVERDPDLKLHQSWVTRDRSILKLYRRKQLPILVEPLTAKIPKIRLEQVVISPASEAKIATTYQLSGDRAALKDGILILNWQSNDLAWNHDRGIGWGELYFQHTQIPSFRITERSAMLTPTKSPLDTYRLTATYLDRRTGESYPLLVPKIEIQPPQSQPQQLDLVSQFYRLGALFAQGKTEPVFNEIAILNQSDPVQDYVFQAQQAIKYRIDRGDNRLELRYTLALSQALQRQIDPLLANLTQVVRWDARNPAAWTYLGVVRLYNWQPQAAETAFQQAERLPNPPSAVATLKIVSALFRCDLPQLWQRLHG